MTTLSKDVKQSALLNQLVLNFDTTEIVGRVKKLWLDVNSHQVKGLTCAYGIFDREKRLFSWQKVVTVGQDSILVNAGEREVEQPESVNNVIGLQVWTDAGNQVGKLVDYCIDTNTGAVVAYLFASNGWRGVANGTYMLSPEAVITVGSKRMIVAEEKIETAQQYEEGLRKKIQHAKQFIQEDISKSQSDFIVALQTSQKVASQLQTKAHQAAEVTSTARRKLTDYCCGRISN
ncbi:MAG: PRC-barrel domain-containing protein [Pleurocapsa sp.]